MVESRYRTLCFQVLGLVRASERPLSEVEIRDQILGIPIPPSFFARWKQGRRHRRFFDDVRIAVTILHRSGHLEYRRIERRGRPRSYAPNRSVWVSSTRYLDGLPDGPLELSDLQRWDRRMIDNAAEAVDEEIKWRSRGEWL